MRRFSILIFILIPILIAAYKPVVDEELDYYESSSVSDTAYNATSWDGIDTVAPSKNAVRDMREAISAGSGDVESVGDCTSGACYDGTSDGGTYIDLYEADGKTRIQTGNNAAAVTLTLPNTTGTLIHTEVDPTVDSSAKIQAIIGAGVYQPSDADLTTWAGITPGANVGTLLATPSSANLLAAITDETGSASGTPLLVLNQNPTINGSTLTGVHDAGGATSFEVPNGTSGTTDATGEIYLDTNGDGGTNFSGEVIQLYNGAVNKYLFLMALPLAASQDNYIPKYDASTKTISWEADASSAFDSTTVEATTWGAGGNASNLWSFNVSGTDHTMTIGNGLMTFSHKLGTSGTTPWESLTVGGDAVISDTSPHLTYRDSSDNTAFQFHLDTADSTWGIFQLWKGTDSGAGFNISNSYPAFYVDTNNTMYIPHLKQSKSFTLLLPVAADDYPIWRVDKQITITNIHVQCTGGTNIVGGLDNYNSDGATILVAIDADITATAGNSVDDDGSLSYPIIPAGNYLFWHTTSISGTPTSVTVTVEFY